MKNNKYYELLNRLLDSTQENRIGWSKTSRQNEYSTDVGDYSITITSLSQSTFSLSKELNEKFALSLINIDGEIVDLQILLPSDSDYNLIADLYSQARFSYFKVDEVLDLLIEELK